MTDDVRADGGAVVDALVALDWSWRVDDLDAAMAALGWKVSTMSKRRGKLQTDRPFNDGLVDLEVDEGDVVRWMVDVTERYQEPRTPEQEELLDAAFAAAGEALAERFGKPRKSKTSQTSALVWDHGVHRIEAWRLRAVVEVVVGNLAIAKRVDGK